MKQFTLFNENNKFVFEIISNNARVVCYKKSGEVRAQYLSLNTARDCYRELMHMGYKSTPPF